MRYSQIRRMDVADGPGIRVSLFTQGCHFHCEGCFNTSTWDFAGGKEYTLETEEQILALCNNPHVAGLSLLGGEPLALENEPEITKLCKKFKEQYPNKTIWCWTGYEFESLKSREVLQYLDVIVTGRFILEERDISLNNIYRGSRNQRVINVSESLIHGQPIPLENIPNNEI